MNPFAGGRNKYPKILVNQRKTDKEELLIYQFPKDWKGSQNL